MIKNNIDKLIENLEKDFVTYRNICSFKLKAIKDPLHGELRKCSVCNGYSSVSECYDFVDIPHLIHFYKTIYLKNRLF